MVMAALSRVVHRPLGHERRDQLLFLKEHLGKRLEKIGPIRGLHPVAGFERRLPTTWAGFAVQPLEVTIE